MLCATVQLNAHSAHICDMDGLTNGGEHEPPTIHTHITLTRSTPLAMLVVHEVDDGVDDDGGHVACHHHN